jgi:hypothetical protein
MSVRIRLPGPCSRVAVPGVPTRWACGVLVLVALGPAAARPDFLVDSRGRHASARTLPSAYAAPICTDETAHLARPERRDSVTSMTRLVEVGDRVARRLTATPNPSELDAARLQSASFPQRDWQGRLLLIPRLPR